MYSLIALFFSIPLYFSHVFSWAGVIIWDSSSFERQKVYLFWILICIALIEVCITKWIKFSSFLKKYGVYVASVILLPILSTYVWWVERSEHFFIWTHEKHHGYIWFALLATLWAILSFLDSREKKILIRTTIYASIIVALFAILEYALGASVFFDHTGEASWWSARSVSTLWNPNYVAGYLLMCLPLFATLRPPERWVYGIVIALAIFTTGSYIALGLTCLYGVYLVLQHFLWIRKSLIFTGIFMIALGYLSLRLIPEEKLLSLESRFVLMQEIWTVMVWYPLSFFFGFGPESIYTYFGGLRTTLIDSYFPASSAIDSSHNIFLDFLFQYGLLPLVLLGYFLSQIWSKMIHAAREGFILGILFLSLNVVVTSHMILLILLLFLYKDSKAKG